MLRHKTDMKQQMKVRHSHRNRLRATAIMGLLVSAGFYSIVSRAEESVKPNSETGSTSILQQMSRESQQPDRPAGPAGDRAAAFWADRNRGHSVIDSQLAYRAAGADGAIRAGRHPAGARHPGRRGHHQALCRRHRMPGAQPGRRRVTGHGFHAPFAGGF